jgi:hypothetical protein
MKVSIADMPDDGRHKAQLRNILLGLNHAFG